MNNVSALELQVLSSLIEYPDQILSFSIQTPPDIFSPPLRNIFKQILKMNEEGLPISTATLFDALGGSESKLLIDIESSLPLFDFMKLVPRLINRRDLRKQGELLSLLNAKNKAGELVNLVEFLDEEAKGLKQKPKTFEEWRLHFEELREIKKIPLGLKFLDRAFDGGLEVGQLVLISGDPEAGKTSIGVQMLEHVAKSEAVCFFCFEFTPRQYIIKNRESLASVAKNNIYLINDGYHIQNVSDKIRALNRNCGARFFLIDSQMRIEVTAARTMEEEESTKFSTLAKLAHSLNLVIILIVQTSKTDSTNPMGSKKGGHESSITIRLDHVKATRDQPDREFDSMHRIITIKKNKQTGIHFKEKIRFNPRFLTFEEVDNVF